MKTKLAFLVAALFASAAMAQQFKWVDKDGRVQYGDAPPAGVKATRLKPPPSGAAPETKAPSASAKNKPLSPEEAFKKRQEEAKEKSEKSAKEQADANTKKENCARAQQNVRTYSAGGRVTTINAQGERVFLDESQIAQELAKAQQAAREACSG